jgi:hypothetical protein
MHHTDAGGGFAAVLPGGRNEYLFRHVRVLVRDIPNANVGRHARFIAFIQL